MQNLYPLILATLLFREDLCQNKFQLIIFKYIKQYLVSHHSDYGLNLSSCIIYLNMTTITKTLASVNNPGALIDYVHTNLARIPLLKLLMQNPLNLPGCIIYKHINGLLLLGFNPGLSLSRPNSASF